MNHSSIRILTGIALFLVLSSHELFLKADDYFFEEGEKAELYLFNGTFDESDNIIATDRIINPVVLGPGYRYQPQFSDYYNKDDVTFLKFTLGREGTYVAGISTRPRDIVLSGTDFSNYLEHEDLLHVLNARAKAGISDSSARESYAKHVKALLQVGDAPSEHYASELGYPIEFIPLKNPYTLRTGAEMSFQLQLNGKPLKNQVVHVSHRSRGSVKGVEQTYTTNRKGQVSFAMNARGQWYAAAIYMEEGNVDRVDYVSQWATITWEVR